VTGKEKKSVRDVSRGSVSSPKSGEKRREVPGHGETSRGAGSLVPKKKEGGVGEAWRKGTGRKWCRAKYIFAEHCKWERKGTRDRERGEGRLHLGNLGFKGKKSKKGPKYKGRRGTRRKSAVSRKGLTTGTWEKGRKQRRKHPNKKKETNGRQIGGGVGAPTNQRIQRCWRSAVGGKGSRARSEKKGTGSRVNEVGLVQKRDSSR